MRVDFGVHVLYQQIPTVSEGGLGYLKDMCIESFWGSINCCPWLTNAFVSQGTPPQSCLAPRKRACARPEIVNHSVRENRDSDDAQRWQRYCQVHLKSFFMSILGISCPLSQVVCRRYSFLLLPLILWVVSYVLFATGEAQNILFLQPACPYALRCA